MDSAPATTSAPGASNNFTPASPASNSISSSGSSSTLSSPAAKRLKRNDTVLAQLHYNQQLPAFQDVSKRYNGFTCRFLKKPIKMALYSSTMCATVNASVAVFSIPRFLRTRLTAQRC